MSEYIKQNTEAAAEVREQEEEIIHLLKNVVRVKPVKLPLEHPEN